MKQRTPRGSARRSEKPPRPIAVNVHTTTLTLLARLVHKTQRHPSDVIETALGIYEAYVNTKAPLPRPKLPPPRLPRVVTKLNRILPDVVDNLKKGKKHERK